jgi:hypothetical protein
METGSLKDLIELGLKPRRGIPGLILAHFPEIVEARELGWRWRDIAEAMGRSGDEKAMSTAFWRIKKRFESGKLKVPGNDQQYTRKEERKEEKKKSPGLERPVPVGGARLIAEQKPEDLFNSMPKM